MERFRPLDGIAHPTSKAGAIYRARMHGHKAPAHSSLNLQYFSGKTLPAMSFVNLYVGGASVWNPSDRSQIDSALKGAMSDVGLNNVLAQYFGGQPPTTTMLDSVVLPDAAPATVNKDTVEGWVSQMHAGGQLPDSDLASTCYCFLLPQGVVLSDNKAGAQQRLPGEDDEADSKNGLGGYHGSVHAGASSVYYAVGVYSDANNGINAFDASWKNVVATFYHELNEFRTDADVEDAADATSNGEKFLGWYSLKAGEVGDIPITESGGNLSTVMQEVKLTDGSGTVPIQFMWSNDLGAPSGPVDAPTPASK